MTAIFQTKLQRCIYGKINSAFHFNRTGTKMIKLILKNIECILKSNWFIQKEKQNFSQSKFALAYNKCSHTQKLCLQVKSLVLRAVGLQVRRVSAAVSQYYSPCRLALGRKSSSNSKRDEASPMHIHTFSPHAMNVFLALEISSTRLALSAVFSEIIHSLCSGLAGILTSL